MIKRTVTHLQEQLIMAAALLLLKIKYEGTKLLTAN